MKSEARWYHKLHWWILVGMLLGTGIGAALNWADNSHAGAIVSLDVLHERSTLVTAGRDGTVKLWTLSQGSLRWLRTLRGHHGEIRALRSIGPRHFAYIDSGNTLYLRSNDGAEVLRVSLGARKGVRVVGRLVQRDWVLFVGNADGTISRWVGVRKLSLEQTVRAHAAAITLLEWPTPERLVSGSSDHLLRVWGASLKLVAAFDGHRGTLRAATLSSDGTTLFSGDSLGAIRIWDLTRWRSLDALVPQKSAIVGLTIDARQQLISATSDGTLQIWRSGFRQPVKRIATGTKLSAGLMPVGKLLVAAGGKRLDRLVLIDRTVKRADDTVRIEPSSGWLILFQTIGSLFIRLLKMIIIPLVFTSLVVGVASLGDLKRLGRMGLKTLVYYMVTTGLSVLVGLVLVNLIKPGVGVAPLMPAGPGLEPKGMLDILLEIVPTNLFQALASGDILPIIFFSLLLGTALTVIGERGAVVQRFFEGAFEAVLRIVDWIMWLAPLGVMALLATTVAEMGIDLFATLFKYVVTVLVGLAFHGVITLGVVLWTFGGIDPWRYAQQMARALMTAFSTDSSSATLPVTMECVEQAGISNRVSSFVLPLGATVNMDGTALYEAVAAMFIAQVYGIDLSFSQQVVIFLTATLAAIGAAGVPSAGLVTMIIVLRSVGLPLEGIGILVGIDRLLDMCRTTVNVWGDAVGARIIARSEGELDLASSEPTATRVEGE